MAMSSLTKRKQTKAELFQEDRPRNYEQRTLGVLVLDASGSMAGEIGDENAALVRFIGGLKDNPVAAKRVRLAIVIVSGQAPTVVPFADIEEFESPVLVATGSTPLAQGLLAAYTLICDEKTRLTESAVDFNKSAVIALGDFGATDDPELVDQACAIVRKHEEAEQPQDAVAFFPFATEVANECLLERIAKRGIRRLKGNRFDEFFNWVAASLNAMSLSQPGERLRLRDPANDGWATM